MDKQQVLHTLRILDANRTPIEVPVDVHHISFFRYQHDPELRQGHQPILLQNKAQSCSSQTFRHPDSANEGVYDEAQEIFTKLKLFINQSKPAN